MTTKQLLRDIDLGLMKIDKHLYIVLAKDENRLGHQYFKTQLLNTETMGYGETQYALQSFEQAFQHFNKRVHVDYKKKLNEQIKETDDLRKYMREKLRHYIELIKDDMLSVDDLEETLDELIGINCINCDAEIGHRLNCINL